MPELKIGTSTDKSSKHISPVQTELAGGSQDVNYTLSPQLLGQDGGGDEAASSTNSSTVKKKLENKCNGFLYSLKFQFQ